MFLDLCQGLPLNLNSTTPDGTTPLLTVVAYAGNSFASPENIELMQKLVAAGASAAQADNAGRTPLM